VSAHELAQWRAAAVDWQERALNAEAEAERLREALERISLGIAGRKESGLREGEGGGYGLPNQPRTDWELARAALADGAAA
jgi:hypothetical protein